MIWRLESGKEKRYTKKIQKKVKDWKEIKIGKCNNMQKFVEEIRAHLTEKLLSLIHI